MVVKPKNIDEYLAAVSVDKRAALERLRKIIRAAVPKAEECISNQLPAFRLDGKCFVWFGAAANHCAIYGVVGDHKDELKDYDTSQGTIRFQADKAMPAALVRKLIKARIAEKVGRATKHGNIWLCLCSLHVRKSSTRISRTARLSIRRLRNLLF
jgi:uncharacterized protein YdhG (YjbR/CyaY superfamily)